MRPETDVAMTSNSASSELLHFTDHGSGPPLLLVHGLMVTGEMFEPVIEHFAARHRVIAPDLRGHGRSRGLPQPYTAAQLASDLSRLLDHLDIGSTAVLGYSQGGAIAQQLAFACPERCNSLVLACTYAFNMATLRERIEGHLFPLLMQVFGIKRMAKIAVSVGARHLTKQRADWLIGIMADQDQKLMLSAWREAMAFDGRDRLAGIGCPTLIITGSDDGAVPMHHATMLHDGIHGSRLVIIDGADHSLVWTHPAELVRATEEFLGADQACYSSSPLVR